MKVLVQSQVFFKDKEFFVSTINRDSSAVESYGGSYAETIVWEAPLSPSEQPRIVAQGESCRDSVKTHCKFVSDLLEFGRISEEIK